MSEFEKYTIIQNQKIAMQQWERMWSYIWKIWVSYVNEKFFVEMMFGQLSGSLRFDFPQTWIGHAIAIFVPTCAAR